MAAERINFRPDQESHQQANGVEVYAKVIDIRSARRRKPGKLARHEAKHAFLGAKGVGVIHATIRARAHSLGHVLLKRFDSRAAAGSHDEEGNSHDLNIIAANGVNVNSAISAAKEGLIGNDDIIDELGAELEDRTTLDGTQVTNIIDFAERRREMKKVAFSVRDKDGNVETFTRDFKKGEVVVFEPKRKRNLLRYLKRVS